MSSEGCDRTVFLLLYTESPSFYTKRPGTSAFTSDMEPTTEALAHMEPAGPLSTQEGNSNERPCFTGRSEAPGAALPGRPGAEGGRGLEHAPHRPPHAPREPEQQN